MNIAVTIARAIELKHKPSIVSALAYETSRMYQDAGQTFNYAGKILHPTCLLKVLIRCINSVQCAGADPGFGQGGP